MSSIRHATVRLPGASAWRRGRLLAVLAILVALLLVGHEYVPNRYGRLGSLLDTFLPWLGAAVPVLLLLAVVRRSATAVLCALVPLFAWIWVFLPQLLPQEPVTYDLTVVQHNVSDENTDVEGTVEVLLATDPDVVALEELVEGNGAAFEAALEAGYPYSARQGTVGLWSRYPLVDVAPVNLQPTGVDASWDRGLRATARTPSGDVAVYVVHLPSTRVRLTGFDTAWRDESVGLLAQALAAEEAQAVVVAGDLNAELRDRALGPVLQHVTAPEHLFQLTYAPPVPVVRVDHVLAGGAGDAGARVVRSWALPRTGSDHLPVAAYVSLP